MAKLVWPVRVSVELGGRIDAAAREAGLKRSVWMVRALEKAVGDRTFISDGPEVRLGSGMGRSASASRAERPGVRVDTPSQAQQWALDRQAKLNAAKDRA